MFTVIYGYLHLCKYTYPSANRNPITHHYAYRRTNGNIIANLYARANDNLILNQHTNYDTCNNPITD